MAPGSPAALALGALQPRLQHQLQALLPGLRVQVAEELGSSNTTALEAARATPAGQPVQPLLLVALRQTAGRGRLGRPWQAAPGASLTFSLALPLAPRSWNGLSLAVGLALAEALDPQGGAAAPAAGTPRLRLKWPNDLWLSDAPGQGRKLGGILIETVQVDTARVCVVGVGLNIAAPAVQGLAVEAAWLQLLDPTWTLATALQACAAPLLAGVLAFEQQGFAPLLPAYAARDLLRGQQVHTLHPDAAGVQGLATGVDADGALGLQLADGRLHRVLSGEVSVRLQPGPRAAQRATPAQADGADIPRPSAAAPPAEGAC